MMCQYSTCKCVVGAYLSLSVTFTGTHLPRNAPQWTSTIVSSKALKQGSHAPGLGGAPRAQSILKNTTAQALPSSRMRRTPPHSQRERPAGCWEVKGGLVPPPYWARCFSSAPGWVCFPFRAGRQRTPVSLSLFCTESAFAALPG